MNFLVVVFLSSLLSFSAALECYQSFSNTSSLVTPAGGVVLVPFSSASTSLAPCDGGLMFCSVSISTVLSGVSGDANVSAAKNSTACYDWITSAYINGALWETYTPHLGSPCTQNSFSIGVGTGTTGQGYLPLWYLNASTYQVQFVTNSSANMSCLDPAVCVSSAQQWNVTTNITAYLIRNVATLDTPLVLNGVSGLGAFPVLIDLSAFATDLGLSNGSSALQITFESTNGSYNSTVQLHNKTGPFVAPSQEVLNGLLRQVTVLLPSQQVSPLSNFTVRFFPTSASYVADTLTVTFSIVSTTSPHGWTKRDTILAAALGAVLAVLLLVGIVVVVLFTKRRSSYKPLA